MSKKTPIVLINWNSIDVLELTLQYIQRYTDLNKVALTVIDNGSDDEASLKRLSELKKRGVISQLISITSHVGFSNAFNIGAEMTEGDVFCYVSYDCLVRPNWFEEGIKTLESSNTIAAVCSNVFNRHQVDDLPVKHFYGAIMFIRREAWNAVGCFDYKNFSPAYCEEIDWGYRALRMGYEIKIAASSLADHIESYADKVSKNANKIYLLRLTHRIKYRLFNWSRQEIFYYWKIYILETLEEVRNGRFHLLCWALVRNFFILDIIYRERKKRREKEKITFDFSYRKYLSHADNLYIITPVQTSALSLDRLKFRHGISEI